MQAQSDQQSEAVRRRLLHLILTGRPVPRSAIAELCEQTGWTLPEQVTLVAVRAPSGLDRISADHDVLIDPGDPQPHLLIPGPMDDARREMLDRTIPGGGAAIGLTVPTALAADSIRWARRVLELVDAGVIDDAPSSSARTTSSPCGSSPTPPSSTSSPSANWPPCPASAPHGASG